MFSSADEAAQVLTDAISTGDQQSIEMILGADFLLLLPLDQMSRTNIDRYLELYEQSHSLQKLSENQYLLAIGKNQWTLPIPITKIKEGWYFDTIDGIERMRFRRIGRNELNTMQAALAYYDAQIEYANQDRNGNGMLEYAQKFISSPDSKDGLFWETKTDETPSPLGPLFTEKITGRTYHGYRYRMLKSQGEHAHGGAYNYLIGKRMVAGFAVIAWPADYGQTGVMSFIVNHQGIVYEQNLGPDSDTVAVDMQRFDPNQDVAESEFR